MQQHKIFHIKSNDSWLKLCWNLVLSHLKDSLNWNKWRSFKTSWTGVLLTAIADHRDISGGGPRRQQQWHARQCLELKPRHRDPTGRAASSRELEYPYWLFFKQENKASREFNALFTNEKQKYVKKVVVFTAEHHSNCHHHRITSSYCFMHGRVGWFTHTRLLHFYATVIMDNAIP